MTTYPIPNELPKPLLDWIADPVNWVLTDEGKLHFLDIHKLQVFIRENVPGCNDPWFANRIYEICLHPDAFSANHPGIKQILDAHQTAKSLSRPMQLFALTNKRIAIGKQIKALHEDPFYVD